MKKTRTYFLHTALPAILGVALVFFGFPFSSTPQAEAATFQVQTGYYIGDGTDNRAITGVGFQPEMVLIKDDGLEGDNGVLYKTSSMASELTLSIAETDASLTTNHIQSFNSDGFTVGNDADTNTDNSHYFWVAFAGSDCTASGTFCVGSYTGNGTSQSVNTGFQPDFVGVKRDGASLGIFKTVAHSGTVSSYFSATADLASGGISSLDASGFTVGSNASANTSSNTYYFFAFKNTDNAFETNSYVGTGLDSNDINSTDNADLDFQSDFVLVKNTTTGNGVYAVREFYGDRSFVGTDSSSAADLVQRLYSTGGFQVGANGAVNTNAVTYYYAVWGGAATKTSGTEDFEMINGSYTGTGLAFSVTGLPFAPDLVMIKHNDQATDQHAVWKSRSMGVGDTTAYFANNVTTFTGGITALTSDGFSVGTSALTNTSGDTYYWTAFGNATLPDKSGNSDQFFVGRYIGSAQDNRDIDRIPLQPEFVFIKPRSTIVGLWKTTSLVGDSAVGLSAVASAANQIQAFNSNGFQIGTTNVNGAQVIQDYFGFRESTCTEAGKFCLGTYTGNGSTQNITSIGFQPDLLWTKKTTGGTARAGLFRTSVQTGDSTSQFLALPTITGAITNLLKNGLSLGSDTGGNESTFTYMFAAWDAKRYTQSTYRFFENTNSTDVGSVLAAQNTAATLASAGDAFRLRMTLRSDYGNLFASGKDFKLQYVDKGAGTCASPSGGTPASYTDVTGATLIAYNNNATPADDAALTSNANDPTDSGRTIVNQSYIESNPFTNNQSAITNQAQSGKWDFSLIDNGADPDTTFCFRVVGNTSATVLDTYSNYPEITTAASVSQSLSFSLSDNTIGFGTLSSSAARYATGDTNGSAGDSADAHTISASTNASGGYVISVSGSTLTCAGCGGATIDAIGASATASSAGTEQFGLRGTVNSGNGTVSAPYNGANWALDTAAFPDAFATGSGDGTTTQFGLRYIGNIGSVTEAGTYTGTLTYTITASY